MSPQFWSQFNWQFEQGLRFLFMPPFLLLFAALLLNLLAASLQANKSAVKIWRPFPWLMLSQFLAWPAIVAIGVLGQYHAPPGDTSWGGDPVWWASWSLNGIDALCFAVGLYATFRMKGMRWFAISMWLLCQAPMLGARAITFMSITGRWI